MARIAFFLPDFGGGGAERVALTVMRGLVERGHDVDLVLCRARGMLLNELPASIRVVDLNADRIRESFIPLSKYLRTHRPAALQASMWPLTTIAIVASAVSGAGNRVVVSEHSALSRAYASRGRWHRALLAGSIRNLYPKASARIAVSQGVRDDLAAFDVPPDMIDVVRNPIPDAGTPGVEFTWPGRGRRILSVGNLGPAKNQALLIRSFAQVARRHECSLVICGEGPLRSELIALADQLGVREQVFLPGYVANITPVFAAAEVFALPSDWEGYSLALVEALRAGLPVVATDCQFGPREVLADGQFGALVKVGDVDGLSDALCAALEKPGDPSPRRQRAVELSGRDSIDRYEQLLLGTGPEA